MSYSHHNNKRLCCYRHILFILLFGMLYDHHFNIGVFAQTTTVEFNLFQTPNTFIGPIYTGSVINLSTLNSRNSTIVANVITTNTTTNTTIPNTNIRNVKFWFNGITIRSERIAPYAITGDTRGQLVPFTNLTIKGNHTVMANVHHLNGTLLSSKSIRFVIDDFIPPPPTNMPSIYPTSVPSIRPTKIPSHVPSISPTRMPSYVPSVDPTGTPSHVPSNRPSKFPSRIPTTFPSRTPSIDPSRYPTLQPSTTPTEIPIVQIRGELRKWHKVTFAFNGPFATENDTYNPFLNYRFNIQFVHTITNKTYYVPGYFAADGNAAETGATSGNQWFCHFTPDEIGLWTYTVQFVTGINISTSTNEVGTPTSFHGFNGSFVIQNTNKTGRDHRGKGRLQYVGKHHMQFAETGEWFLKVGADSPENFLAYNDFDNTPNTGNRRKSWAPHIQHYNPSTDPSWRNGNGTGMIGAINYLSNQGMNAFSFLTMNINGDDRNVYPYVSDQNFLRMDVSKLAQWEIVFEHADKMGMLMHFKTSERENDDLLDGGALGVERKLYYRELIARFGHHLALLWNIAEEVTLSVSRIKTLSDYIKETDPYQHIVVTHTASNSQLYSQLTGYNSFDGPSLQTSPFNVFNNTLQWVRASASAGHKWIVTNDEQNSAKDGVVPDSVDPNHDIIRQFVLWGNVMAGGAGVEYYFGYGHPNSDLSCQDYSSRQNMWVQSKYMIDFFTTNTIPYWDMSNEPNRLSNNKKGWISSNTNGSIFLVYLRGIDSTMGIVLSNHPGIYTVQWYNPRTGGPLQNGSITTMVGGRTTKVLFGSPPDPFDIKDWVVLLRKV